MFKKLSVLSVLCGAYFITACSDSSITDPGTKPPVTTDTIAPALLREMRGLWIATVANIDWPKSSSLTADQQKAELIDILNKAAAAGINTVILQVRPAGDAVYASGLEPWAILLTGTSGKDPGYDPLSFAVQEAHARGLELHAWINPFRAGNTSDTLRLAFNHIFNARRDLVRVYSSSIWMDPGEPDVQDRSIAAIKDIVSRYDIDGLTIDDFFYPYPVGSLVFPDSATYARYGAGMTRDDWRRSNIDKFVERMYREVHLVKPQVKVGISPFGIWRSGNPAGVVGLDAYASIYADSRKWLQQGWLDYFAPQLYWAISAPQQSFPALLDWWRSQNLTGKHVWPAIADYRVSGCGSTAVYPLQEIPDQILLTRNRSNQPGVLHYNTTCTLKYNSGALATALASDLYKNVALVPASPWLDPTIPSAPTVNVTSNVLQITPAAGEAARWWAIRIQKGGTWKTRVVFGTDRTIQLEAGITRVLVQAVDQAGNLSPTTVWQIAV
jgi:uncharacterized lipoprotein YddW (UPF0748 family)